MNRNRTRFTRLALLAGALYASTGGIGFQGCSGGSGVADDQTVVAEVGGRQIKLRQITDYLTALHVDYPTTAKELEARQKQLDKLIEDQLLIIGAYSQSLDADIGIIELVDREKDKFLLDELFRHEVIDKATVTDDEIREVYAHWFEKVWPQHIMVDRKSLADSLVAELKAGANFGDLAEAHSIDRGTAVRAGDFGRDFRWGELLPALQDVAFSLKEGEIGGPVQSEYGWHILRLKLRTLEDKKPIEEVWTQIENLLLRTAREERRLAQLDAVRAGANIKLAPEGLSALREQVRLVSDPGSPVLRARQNIPVDSLSEQVKNLVVATFGRDGKVTLAEMAQRINSRPWEGRADVADDEQVIESAFQLALFDLLREEALRLRMDEQPLYKERLQEFREKLMADKMRSTIISRNLRIPEEDVRAYYDAHPDSFVEPTGYHVREVMVHDSLMARQILERARRGKPLAELAAEYTERTGFKGNGGDLGWVRPNRYPDLYEPASQLKIGEVGGPYAGVDQYSIIEVIGTEPPRQKEYGEVQPSLFKRIQEARSDSIMTTYIDSMKVLHPVVIQEDVLRQDLRVSETATASGEPG